MDAGLVGLPNAGKSTLFNALTAGRAPVANYPFSTIDPHVGVAPVPDARLEIIARHVPTGRTVPAALRVVDIAGLVRGASRGEGLGNQFLAHVRDVDAIVHVVRCFRHVPGGEIVPHVEGNLDPLRDIATVETELILADLQSVENALPKAQRAARSREPEAMARLAMLERVRATLAAGLPARAAADSDPDLMSRLRQAGLITAKRVVYVMNVDEEDLSGTSEAAARVRQHAWTQQAEAVPVCARLEAELLDLPPDERAAMLADLGMSEPALTKVAHAARRALNLITFFTVNRREARAWLIPAGTRAARAAGVVHSDFERGFIRADVYAVEDLERYGSERGIRDAGHLRSEGRDYVVRDGDVCLFHCHA